MKPTKPSKAYNHTSDLGQRAKDKISAIAAVSKDLPSVIIIYNLKTKSVEYMSERGLEILKTSAKELQDLGPDYFYKFFNPEDAQDYVPKFLDLLERNDIHEVFTFFQQVCASGDKEWEWYLSASKVLMCDDENIPYLTITAAHHVHKLKTITYKLEKLLLEKETMRTEIDKYILLTKREKEIITLVVAGDSSIGISEKLFISFSTVEQHRKNIKKKLNIKNTPDLVRFAQAFNIES
jgi:DNA-binding CsgD family transcriptional regulator